MSVHKMLRPAYLLIIIAVISLYNTLSQSERLRFSWNKLLSGGVTAGRHLDSSQLAHYFKKREAESLAFFRSSRNAKESGKSKILWMFWEQGLDHLESLAKGGRRSKNKADYHCVQAWQALNPTWDVRVLNESEAIRLAPKYALLANDKSGRHNTVKRSNVLRLELLSRYGGVWSDTSNCPFRPLDSFLPQLLGTQGFYAPYLGGPNMAGGLSGPDLLQFEDCHKFHLFGDWMSARARSFATWFMAVDQPHHLFIDAFLEALFERMVEVLRLKSCAWNNRQCFYPYHIAHCTFTQVRMRNKTIDEAWTRYRETRPSKRGVCFGKATGSHGPINVDTARHRCYFVKKQVGELAVFVSSEDYLNETMKQLAASAIENTS